MKYHIKTVHEEKRLSALNFELHFYEEVKEQIIENGSEKRLKNRNCFQKNLQKNTAKKFSNIPVINIKDTKKIAQQNSSDLERADERLSEPGTKTSENKKEQDYIDKNLEPSKKLVDLKHKQTFGSDSLSNN
jgi:hypothetical protein